jgi:hypothetical protein
MNAISEVKTATHNGIWAVAEMVPLPSWFVAGCIWVGAGIILIILGLWFVLEGVLYFQQQPPITPVIRTWTNQHGIIATIIGLALVAAAVAAFIHFVADR